MENSDVLVSINFLVIIEHWAPVVALSGKEENFMMYIQIAVPFAFSPEIYSIFG